MFYAHLAEIHNRQNPAVAFFGNTCEAVMMCGTVENRFVEWRAAVCQDSEKNGFLTYVSDFLAALPARYAKPAGIILKLSEITVL